MKKKIAILQSNYIPWKGYFDIISASDTFIFLDDVQYTKNDWRNRNKIKGLKGEQWMTIPIRIDNFPHQRVCESVASYDKWSIKHLKTIEQNYRKAPFFNEIKDFLYPLYDQAAKYDYLSQINFLFIKAICDYLEIKTKLAWSTEYFNFKELDSFSSTERLLKLCQAEEADIYISGPAAKSYMNLQLFQDAKIEVKWANYSGYPEYSQLYGDFVHCVSIIDMLMMLGKRTKEHMKNGKKCY